MREHQLQEFRELYSAMQSEPSDWQWIGPHMSQRHFGITRSRAQAFAQRFGGDASRMPQHCRRCGVAKPAGKDCSCNWFDNGCQ
jgi:hypothetical protein